MQQKEFINCNHGLEEESKYDFLPTFSYKENINEKLKKINIDKYDLETNIKLKLAINAFIDMYKDDAEIINSLDQTEITFIDGPLIINGRNNILGQYMPIEMKDPFNEKPTGKTKIIIPNQIGNKRIPKIEQYISLIHELRHHIVSLKNNHIVEDNIYVRRIGLCEEVFRKNEDKISFNRLLDETYNQYISEILINNILSIKNTKIEDPNVKKVLFDMKNPEERGYYKNLSYYDSLRLLHPILRNEKLTNQINQLTYTGDLEKIYDLFKIIFNEDFYKFGYEFSKSFESIENYNKMKSKIKTMENDLNKWSK